MSNQSVLNMINQIRKRAMDDLYKGKLNYDITMPFLLRQLDILKEIGDQTQIGVFYNSLAVIELELGNYSTSHEYYHKALYAYEEAGQQGRYAATLCGLGELYRETGDVESAADCYQRSRAIAEQENDKRIVIYNYSNEGQLWLSAGQTEQAIELLETGLSVTEEARWLSDIRHKVLPEILISLAEAYARQEKYELAWENVERGLALASKSDELHQMAHAYQTKARIAIDEGRPEVEIDAYFEKSAELWRQLGMLPDLGRLLIAAGEFFVDLRKVDKAAKLFKEAGESFELAHMDDEADEARSRVSQLG
jgi:tetratricopeptide (TPR) repeat protein